MAIVLSTRPCTSWGQPPPGNFEFLLLRKSILVQSEALDDKTHSVVNLLAKSTVEW